MDETLVSTLKRIALLGGVDDYIIVSSKELGDSLEMSQQSASKKILELLEAKMIVRSLGTRKQRIKLTEKGMDVLKKEYNEYRRIFEYTDTVIIHGKVASGMGEGGYYICQKPYMEQFEKKLGFIPFEGTFNVAIEKNEINKLDLIKATSGILIEGFTSEGRSFGNVIAYKAKLHNMDCAIVVPERTIYREVLEIICQYNLRRSLLVKDGDDVDVKVQL